MKFTMRVDMDNAAFDSPQPELLAVLDQARAQLANPGRWLAELGELGGTLHDSNGNRVGEWRISA